VRRPTLCCGVQLFSASCRHYHTSSSSPRPHPPPPTSTTPSTSSFLLPRASPRTSHASEPLLPDRHHDCASAPCNNSWTTRVYTDVSLPPTRAVAATGKPSIALVTLNKITPVDQSRALINLVDFLGLDRILGCNTHSKAGSCLALSLPWYAALRIRKSCSGIWKSLTLHSKVLFKRKPVALIPHPVNIKDDAEVRWEHMIYNQLGISGH
jgi:hypothetical protein